MVHKCTKESVFTKLFVAQESIQKDVTHMREQLDGNGVPGYFKKADTAYDYIIAQKQKEETENKVEKWSRKKLLFWGGIIFILIQFVFEIIKIKIFGG